MFVIFSDLKKYSGIVVYKLRIKNISIPIPQCHMNTCRKEEFHFHGQNPYGQHHIKQPMLPYGYPKPQLSPL